MTHGGGFIATDLASVAGSSGYEKEHLLVLLQFKFSILSKINLKVSHLK